MKAMTALLLFSGLLMLTACNENKQSKITNPFAGHAEALQKAKDLKKQVEEATDQKIKQLNNLH